VRWVGLATFAALPLQWFVVFGSPLGTIRLHQVAFLGLCALLVVRMRFASYVPVLHSTWPFIVLNVYVLTLWAMVSVYHAMLPTGAVQELIYLGVFVVFAAFILRAATDPELRVVCTLRWAAAAAAVALVVGLQISALHNGVNSLAVLQQAASAGDPAVLQRDLFLASFGGFGFDEETARANFRHEVFGALLLAMYVSAWAFRLRPLAGAVARGCYRASMLVCVLLLAVSMSRAVLIAAAVWPLLAIWRAARARQLTGRQLIGAAGSVGALALLGISGLGQVVWTKFTEDTTSYESREGLYSGAMADIGAHLWLGGVDTSGQSSHNFVLDAWLRGGVLVAAFAAALLLYLVVVWLAWIARLPFEPVWMVPVVAALALPIDRMLTAGGGLIPPVSWLALAFAAGAIAARTRGRPQRQTAGPGLTPGVAHAGRA
jgi:hypothetical protein